MRRRALFEAVGFVGLVAVATAAAGPSIGLAAALVGWAPTGVAGMWLYGTAWTALLLGLTCLLLRLNGEPVATLGLNLNARRAHELGIGFAATAALFAAIALTRAVAVGASWQFSGVGGLRAAAAALPFVVLLALGEELVFRGYGFRKVVTACGAVPALVLSALAFGLYHLALAQFRPWGIGAFFVVTMPALGGLLFGVAALKTRGLALPLGLHAGGNWIQASGFVFGGFGAPPPSAVFAATVTAPQAQALAAPDLLPHLPYLLAIGIAGLLVARWPVESRASRPCPARS